MATTAITTPVRAKPEPKLQPKLWDPKNSDDEVAARKPLGKDGARIKLRATRSVDWHDAPGTSHVQRFRLFDPRDPAAVEFLEQFGGRKAVIQLRFKASKTAGVSEYLYFFDNLKKAGQIWNEIVNADHPGETVYYKLRLARVPYTKTFG